MQAVKLIVQVAVAGSRILGKAFVDAYRQAAQRKLKGEK
jgi:hypothetical protein